MMKKLLAVLVVTALMLSMVAYAAPAAGGGGGDSAGVPPTDLTGVITDLGKTPPIRRTIDVPVNMMVDAGQKGTFVDGVVKKEIEGSTLDADYKATIYMKDVLVQDCLLQNQMEPW